jgi:hypothetical protein
MGSCIEATLHGFKDESILALAARGSQFLDSDPSAGAMPMLRTSLYANRNPQKALALQSVRSKNDVTSITFFCHVGMPRASRL